MTIDKLFRTSLNHRLIYALACFFLDLVGLKYRPLFSDGMFRVCSDFKLGVPANGPWF